MKQPAIDKVVRKTRRNYNFGSAVIFEGRCIQAFPEENGDFALVSGCYSDIADLPEFEGMKAAGTLTFKTVNMGGDLVKVMATMSEEQFKKYLASADEADCEA